MCPQGVQKKGFDVLVDACRILAEREISFQLHIIGDGPMRETLDTQVRTLGLAEVIQILPGRAQTELPEALAEASVFALVPAIQADGDRDGIPDVLLEAMTAGMAVVSTDVSGSPEAIVDRHNGRLVASPDPEALAEVLAELISDPAQRSALGAEARTIGANRNLAACVRPLTEALQAVLNECR